MSTSNNPYRDSRRNFIKHSGMVSVGFLGLHHFAFSSPTQHAANEAYDRYGPLLTDPRSEERRVGKSVSVRVDLGGRRIIKKKKKILCNTETLISHSRNT